MSTLMYLGFVKPLLQVLICATNQGHIGGAWHDMYVSSTLGASSNLFLSSYSSFESKVKFYFNMFCKLLL
jgi:hypothetical protein